VALLLSAAALALLILLYVSGTNIWSQCICNTIQQPVVDGNTTSLIESYLQLVEMAVTGSLFDEMGRCGSFEAACPLTELKPYDKKLREGGEDWPSVGHTMVGHKRLRNIRLAIDSVVTNNVPGSFVELGVWRGGACIYARALLNTLNQRQRKVFVFDAFETLHDYGARASFLAVSEAQVRHNFEKYGLFDEQNVFFLKGLFKNTTPTFHKTNTEPIAVLRVDGNFYDSHQDAMYNLYEFVPVGGFVIFDDIRSHPAVQRFWSDFKREQNIPEDFIVVDANCGYFRKTKDVKLDWKFIRPPQDVNL